MQTMLPGPLRWSPSQSSPSATMNTSPSSWRCTGSEWSGAYSMYCTRVTVSTPCVSGLKRILPRPFFPSYIDQSRSAGSMRNTSPMAGSRARRDLERPRIGRGGAAAELVHREGPLRDHAPARRAVVAVAVGLPDGDAADRALHLVVVARHRVRAHVDPREILGAQALHVGEH